MITDPSKKFSVILGNIIDSNLNAVDPATLNPVNQNTTNILSNATPSFPVSPSISNYNWVWNYFSFFPETNYPVIGNDIFNYAIGPIYSQDIRSDNGNLTLLNVPQNQIHKFSANVFNNSSKSTSLNFTWNNSLLLQINNKTVVSNQFNNPFFSANNFIDVSIPTGWNEIDIYIYVSSGNTNFSINSPLGSVVDQWGTSTLLPPPIPSGLTVTPDSNSVGMRDPNTNILKWIQNPPADTFGYDIYRRGPYNSGLTIPSFNLSITSGYYISGISGIINQANYQGVPYYKVSAINSGGETISSNELKANMLVASTGIVFLTGNSYSAGGSLTTGMYNYFVFQKTYAGQYIYNGQGNSYLQVLNTGNVVELDWSLSSSLYGIDIYRQSVVNPFQFDFNPGSFSGVLLTGFFNRSQFIDSGLTGSTITGINLLDTTSSYFKNANNSMYLNWTGVNNASSYNLYRTFYSGIYPKGSLIVSLTGTTYIDSGVILPTISAQNKGPVDYEHIGSIGYGLPTYKDVGLFTNRTYDYAVSAYDFNLIDSNRSQPFTITAGDPNAPNTPSGITINSFNGFATIGWQNGVEPDLAGTIIYESVDGIVPFVEIGRTVAPANTLTEFIGYSGVPQFKLANFDTSQNISPQSTGIIGSAVMKADNIILSNFNIMSTQDIDLDYYLPSGTSLINQGIASSQIMPMVVSNYNSSNENQFSMWWAYFNLNSTSQTNGWTPSVSGIDNVSNIYSMGSFDITPTISGFGASAIIIATGAAYSGKPYLANNIMMTYYSGGLNTNYLHYNTYSLLNGTTKYKTMTTSTSGINVGSYFIGNNANAEKYTSPLIITSSGNTDNNVIIFISGVNGQSPSFGFISLNASGNMNNSIKYMQLPPNNAPINQTNDFSACFDNNGNIDLMWNAAQSVSNIAWYKININKGTNSPITVVNSGQYTSFGVGGFLFPFNPFNTVQGQALYPRIFYDKQNYLNMFFVYNFYNNSNINVTPNVSLYNLYDISYARMNPLGAMDIQPTFLYHLPFNADINSWNVCYSDKTDESYLNYNLLTLPNLTRNKSYGYQQGSYRRKSVFERYTNASLYQIIQSTIK